MAIGAYETGASEQLVIGLPQVAINMARHGMVVVEDIENDELRIVQPFENIDSPDMYIFREGFDYYRDAHRLGVHLVSKVFSNLIYYKPEGGPGLFRSYKDFKPDPFPGIDIATRRELGVPRYPIFNATYGVIQYVSRFGIRAGSLIAAATTLKQRGDEGIPTSSRDQVILDMSQELEERFS